MSSEIAIVSSREKWTSSPAVWSAHSSNSTKSSKHGSAFWLSLSDVFMYWHLPCLHSSLEWEQLLEQHRTLQDSFDQLQAEAKFEADQAGQQIEDLKTQLTVSVIINSTINIFILKCKLWCFDFLYFIFYVVAVTLCRSSQTVST